jgi:formate dehydrogenase assembly factor FdhD
MSDSMRPSANDPVPEDASDHRLRHETRASALAARVLAEGVYAYESELGIYYGGSQGSAWVTPADVTALALGYREADAERASAEQAVADVMTQCERLEAERDRLRAALETARDVRPWLVCDATCLYCAEGEPCPSQAQLARIDAALRATCPTKEGA